MSRTEIRHEVMIERLSAVLSSTRAISSKLHLEEAIRAILAEGRRILGARASALWLLDESGEDCELYLNEGNTPDEIERVKEKRRAAVGFKAAIESREIIVPDLERQEGRAESFFLQPSPVFKAVFAVPLKVRGATLGSMVFAYAEPKVPSESELELARTFASHAAVAIQNARLFNRTKDQVSQLRALAAAARSLATAARSLAEAEELDEVLNVILAEVRRVLGADRCRVARWKDRTGRERAELASQGLSNSYLTELDRRVASGLHTIAAMPGNPVVVEDARTDPRLAGIRDLVLLEGFVTLVHLSLSSCGEPIGTLAIYYDETRHYSPEDLALAQVFADLAAAAIKEAEHRAGLLQERDRLKGLALAAGSLAEAEELDEVLRTILAEVRRVLGADRCRILRWSDESESGRLELASHGLSEAYLTELKRRIAAGLYDPAMAEPGKPVQVVDARTDPRLARIHDLVLNEGFVTIVGLSMPVHGTPIGSLVIYHNEERPYTPEDLALAQAFADLAATAIKEADDRTGLRRERDRLKALAVAAERVTSELETEAALKAVMEQGSRVLGADRCAFWVHDERTGQLELFVNRGLSEAFVTDLMSKRDSWFAPRVMASGKPVVSEDARAAVELRHMWEAYGREGIRTVVHLPLQYLERPIGTLVFYHDAPRRYGQGDLDLAMTFAHQAAIAIQNARSFEATQEQVSRLHALAVAGHSLAEAEELDEVLDVILDEVRRVLSADRCCISRWRDQPGGSQILLALNGLSLAYFTEMNRRAAAGIHSIVTNTEKPVVVEDARTDLRFEAIRDLVLAEGFVTTVDLPMRVHGKPLGILAIYYGEQMHYAPADLALAQAFADLAATAIKEADDRTGLRRERDRLKALAVAAERVTSELETEAALKAVMEQGSRVLGADRCAFWVHDERTGQLELFVNRGLSEAFVTDLMSKRDSWFAPRVMASGKPVVSEDARAAVELRHMWEAYGREGIRTVVHLPLQYLERPIGTLVFYHDAPRRYGQGDLDLAMTFAHQAGIAIQNARLFRDKTQSVERLSAILSVTRAISSKLHLEEAIRAILGEGRRILQARSSTVWMLNETGDDCQPYVGEGYTPEEIERLKEERRAAVGFKAALESREVIVPDLTQQEEEPENVLMQLSGAFVGAFAVPLKLGDITLGSMGFTYPAPKVPSEGEVELARTFASHAAVAIENARLFERTQEQVSRLQALASAAHSLAEAEDLNEVLDVILDEVRRVLGADRCRIARWKDETQGARIELASYGLSKAYLTELARRIEAGLHSIPANLERAIIAEDARTAPRLEGIRDLIVEEGFVTLVNFPMRVRGKPLGILSVYHDEKRQYAPEDLTLAQAFADLAAAAINEADDRAGLRRERDRLKALAAAAERVTSELEPEGALKAVMEEGSRVLGADRCAFWLQDEQTGQLELLLNQGLSEPYLADLLSRRDAWVTPKVLESNKPAAFEDARTAAELSHMWDAYEREGIRTAVFLPLSYQERPLGVLAYYHGAPQRYAPADLDLAMTFAHQAAITIQNAREFSKRMKGEVQIREQNEFLNNILESLTHPFYVIDTNDYTIKIANSAACLGTLTQDSTCYALTHRESKPCGDAENPCPLKEVKRTKKPVIVEHIHYDKDGNARNVEVHGYPIFDNNGNVIQLIEYSLDITEQRRAQQLALQAERLSALGQLVAGVAHELNNPLTVIMMCAQLIQAAPGSTEHGKEAETIISQTERCARVVEKLLAFSRESDKREEELDLADVMQDTLDPASSTLSLHNIEVSFDAPKGECFVLGDRHLLQQVFINLITNAQHALEDRESPRSLKIDIRPRGSECVVSVADNGCGIPQEALRKVFDPFFTTKGEGKGTGLGLSLSYGIVKDHGGDITLESRLNVGTTVKVTLPRLEAPGRRKAAVNHSESWSSLSGRHILVIEDEMSICKYLRNALSPVGMEVSAAHSLAEAREALLKATPDLILADIRLPDGDGFHLYEELTASGLVSPDHFAFMSGDIASEGTRERLQGSGRPYIPKPFGVNDVRGFLCTWIKGNGKAEAEGSDGGG